MGSVSQNSPYNGTKNMSVGTALREAEIGQDCLESFGLDLDRKNVIPENVFADTPRAVHDMVTGTSERKPLEKERTRMSKHPIQKKQHHANAQIQPLALKIASFESQQNISHYFTSKMPIALTLTLTIFGL